MSHGAWRAWWAGVAVVGAVLLFGYELVTALTGEPWLLGLTLGLILGGPLVGYLVGRSHEWHHTRAHLDAFHAAFSGSSRGFPALIEGRSRPARRPLQIYYGERTREAVDYKQLAFQWLAHGWPTFDRTYLRRRGVEVGANENYTRLTGCLEANGVIRVEVGRLPDEDERTMPHRLYRWIVPSEDAADWIDQFDWRLLDREV